MAHLTNVHGLPDALVHAVRNDPYQGGGDISVTKLIDAPQKRVLAKKYRDAVVEDVSERIWALMGQAVHTVLERAKTNALVEKRLYADVDGWSLSGQFDRVHLEDGVMQDWKVCSTFKAGGDESWTRQLNVLRWLAAQNDIEVHTLQVVAIFRDWKRAESKRRQDYPQQAVATIQIPVWGLDETLAYVRGRVSLHRQAEIGEPVQCTDEDRWYSGTVYALMKTGGKRAIRLSPVKDELGKPDPGYEIVERKGENRRCEAYCEVSHFCPQYQQIKGADEGSNDVDS